MFLITKITKSQLNDYRKELLQCLNHNCSNSYINQFTVYTDDIDHKINIPNVNIIYSKKLPDDIEIIRQSKISSRFNKIILSEPFIQFQDDLYKITEKDLLSKVFINQYYKIYSKNVKYSISEIFDVEQHHINLSVINILKSEKSKKIENTLIKKSIYNPKKSNSTHRPKKIDVIIVSVNYNDYLLLTLIENKKIFENITVVTSEDDKICQEICEKLGVNCVISGRLYEEGAKFNKGKAINDGIKSIGEPDLILLLDADIIVQDKINIDLLSDDCLYTSSRKIYKDYNSFINKINSIDEVDKGFGFFQLFSFNDSKINKEIPFPENFDSAENCDLEFRDKFSNRESIEKEVIHLGETRKNWNGRVTKKFIDDETFDSLLTYIDSELGIRNNRVLVKNLRDHKIVPKLAVITTFFNPKNYINLRYNYLKFSEKIKKKADLFPIELSFTDNFFIEDENVIQIKGVSENILWQKERLLNIALVNLPKEYTNVAWIDCDIIFENENWVEEVNEKLKDYKVLHLFENAKRLGKNGEVDKFSKSIIKRISELNRVDTDLSKGTPGFAWAMRREVLDNIKFLDTMILGGGDSMMFLSYFNNVDYYQNRTKLKSLHDSYLIKKKYNKDILDMAKEWNKETNRIIDNSINFIGGDIIHLYHGSSNNRDYNNRYDILSESKFNKELDISIGDNNLWKINRNDILLKIDKYFENRNEDDNIININDYFDNIYVINLDMKRDRYEKIKYKLDKINIKFERFSAIDGNSISDTEHDFTNFTKKGLLENKYDLGCLRSHIEVIKDAKNKGYKKILIFEDDVLINSDIEVQFQKIRKIDNWKLLYLGASQYNWDINFIEDFYYSRKTLGCFAYAIDESIYDEILEINKEELSIDNLLLILQSKYYKQCYTFYPNICITDVSESTIRENRDQSIHSERMRWNLLKNYI